MWVPLGYQSRGFPRRKESRFLVGWAWCAKSGPFWRNYYARACSRHKFAIHFSLWGVSWFMTYQLWTFMFSLYFCVAFERSGSVLHMTEFGLHADIERRLALEQPAWFGCSFSIDWILLLMAICLPACLSANRQLLSQWRTFERTLLIYDYYLRRESLCKPSPRRLGFTQTFEFSQTHSSVCIRLCKNGARFIFLL